MTTESMKRRLEATRLINHLVKPCEGSHVQFNPEDADTLMQIFYDMPESEKMFLFEYLFHVTRR